MVDYNNKTTLATPSTDINRVQILERRAYCIQALQKYQYYAFNNASYNTGEFRSKLVSLFWELQGVLFRRFKDDKKLNYDMIIKILNDKNSDFNLVLQIWEKINILLDEINLTRIDVIKKLDNKNNTEKL